jgi:hypothetical protein
MEAGLKCLPAVFLDDDGLYVHGAIKHAHAGAEDNDSDDQTRQPHQGAQQRKSGTQDNRRPDYDRSASIVRSEIPSEGHGHKRSTAEAKQQQPQATIVQAGACFNQWNQRRPSGHE